MFENKVKFTIVAGWICYVCFGMCVHVGKNTLVQLNIPLSRHSYVLDQCYSYSFVIKKKKKNRARLPF